MRRRCTRSGSSSHSSSSSSSSSFRSQSSFWPLLFIIFIFGASFRSSGIIFYTAAFHVHSPHRHTKIASVCSLNNSPSRLQRTIQNTVVTSSKFNGLFSKLKNENDLANEDTNRNDDDDSLAESKPDSTKKYKHDDGSNTIGNAHTSSIFQRFLNPRIDDPGLILSDTLLAQIVAPTLQIYWLLLVNAPSPSWLHPITSSGSVDGFMASSSSSLYGIFSSRGSLLAPTLVHGAGLAVCWLAGALAAKMFEREAFTLGTMTLDGETIKSTKDEDRAKLLFTEKDDELSFLSYSTIVASIHNLIHAYRPIFTRLVQAGAFSSGLLILATQLDLLLEYRGNIVTLGMSDEIDFRLLVATVEVINDIVWEGLVITAWRILHANFMNDEENWWKRL